MKLEFVTFQHSSLEHHQARVDLTNMMYKNHVYTAEQSLAEMAGFIPNEQSLMELVFHDGRCVAAFEANPFQSDLAGQAFFLDIIVHPEFVRQGIGTQAVQRIEQHCAKWDGLLEVQIREDWQAHLEFYGDNGFILEPAFLWFAFELQIEVLSGSFGLANDLYLQTWAEFQDTIVHRTEILEFRNSLAMEFAPSMPTKILSQQYFDTEVLGAFAFNPEFFWVALYNNKIVGTLLCTGYTDDPTFFFEFGGIAVEHRRSGLAIALIIRAMGTAKQHGFQLIEAHVDPKNIGAARLLEKLGFTRRPGYMLARKKL